MKVFADVIPDDCDYLTAGEVYELFNITLDFKGVAVGGVIVDDDGEELWLHLASCSHLKDNPWRVVDE